MQSSDVRVISTADLRAALDQLADDAQLVINSEGNLAVLDEQCNYIAWITFGDCEGQVLRWCSGDTHDARRFSRRLQQKRQREAIRVV